tara:strand:+ start:498 stop:683 length:186 start_codon:yes stop_codon:yes gene_type:complete
LIRKEEIAEAPALDSMSEEGLNYLLSEEMHLGTFDWQSKKFLPNIITTRKRKKDSKKLFKF